MVAVLFDLDGTLIDSLPDVQAAANAVLDGFELPGLARDVVAGFVGLGEQVFVDRLIAATDLQPSDRAEVMTAFIAAYKQAALQTKTFPHVAEALAALQSHRVPMGLVTNKPRGPLLPTLESADLGRFFDVVVAGDDLAVRKPDPAPVRHAMERLGVSDCVYVGDSETDAATAANAGVPFILFTEGIRLSPVEDLPHAERFSDFADLPGLILNMDQAET